MRRRSKPPSRSSSSTASRARSATSAAASTPTNTRTGSCASPSVAVPTKREPSKPPPSAETVPSVCSAGNASSRGRRGRSRRSSCCQPTTAAAPAAQRAISVRGRSSGTTSCSGATAPISAQIPREPRGLPRQRDGRVRALGQLGQDRRRARADQQPARRHLAAVELARQAHDQQLGRGPGEPAEPDARRAQRELRPARPAHERRREGEREPRRGGQRRGVTPLHAAGPPRPRAAPRSRRA